MDYQRVRNEESLDRTPTEHSTTVMASNSGNRGMMRPHHSRSPPFLVIGLTVVVIILGFNYWSLSSRNSDLAKELQEFQDKFRIAALKKMSTDRRNEQLLLKVQEMELNAAKMKTAEDNKIQMYAKDISKKVAELATMQDQLHKYKSQFEQLNKTRHSEFKKEDCPKPACPTLNSSPTPLQVITVECGDAMRQYRDRLLGLVDQLYGWRAANLMKKQVPEPPTSGPAGSIDITNKTKNALSDNIPEQQQVKNAAQQPGGPFIQGQPVGNQLSQNGNKLTQVGNQPLQSGNSIPQGGHQPLQSGDQLPQSGNRFPQDVNHNSQRGNQLIQDGKQIPQSGNQLPQSGNQLGEVGNQLPQGGNQRGNEPLENGNQLPKNENQITRSGSQSLQDGNQIPRSRDQVSQGEIRKQQIQRPHLGVDEVPKIGGNVAIHGFDLDEHGNPPKQGDKLPEKPMALRPAASNSLKTKEAYDPQSAKNIGKMESPDVLSRSVVAKPDVLLKAGNLIPAKSAPQAGAAGQDVAEVKPAVDDKFKADFDDQIGKPDLRGEHAADSKLDPEKKPVDTLDLPNKPVLPSNNEEGGKGAENKDDKLLTGHRSGPRDAQPNAAELSDKQAVEQQKKAVDDLTRGQSNINGYKVLGGDDIMDSPDKPGGADSEKANNAQDRPIESKDHLDAALDLPRYNKFGKSLEDEENAPHEIHASDIDKDDKANFRPM